MPFAEFSSLAFSALLHVIHCRKLDSLCHISLPGSMGLTLTTVVYLAREATEFGEMAQINSHYTIQGHSRSPILVPIESL